MKIKTCLEIASDCGLHTIGEAVYNIDLHAMSIFTYEDINKELQELVADRNKLYSDSGFTMDSSVSDALMFINNKKK